MNPALYHFDPEWDGGSCYSPIQSVGLPMGDGTILIKWKDKWTDEWAIMASEHFHLATECESW